MMILLAESSSTSKQEKTKHEKKEKRYSTSFSASTPTNCPDLFGTFKPALLGLYNEDEPDDFANLLSDDNFINCLNTNVPEECNNKTQMLVNYQQFASLLTNYEIKFYEIKMGMNWIQSNIRLTLTTANGGCAYDINGAFHLYCDENGKITEDVDFLNDEEYNTVVSNILNPDGCVPP